MKVPVNALTPVSESLYAVAWWLGGAAIGFEDSSGDAAPT